MTFTTDVIKPGKSIYYAIQRTAGKLLTVNDANVCVVESDGTKHAASSGKVEFVVEDAMATEFIVFEICNTGSTAKAFTLVFTDLLGSQANPKVLSTVGSYSIEVEKGNSSGYYYKYKAEKAGTLRFAITAATKDSGLTITNNRNSIQMNLEVLTSEVGTSYVELEVNAGDEIIIQVHALPDKRYKYPATNVTWELKY